MKSISLALIDDHPIIVEGLMHVLGLQNAFTVVATGASSREALAVADKDRPDLMIVGLSAPDDALHTISAIKAKHPSVKILVFTADFGVEHAVSALEAGAHGYLSKSCQMEELLQAVKAAMAGETYISRNLAGRVLAALRNASIRKITIQALKLSAREDQIVRLLLGGKTNREMSCDLGITERTVKHYMTVLMQKLNARNRVEAVIAAQNLNRFPIGSPVSNENGFVNGGQAYMTSGRSYHS